MGKGKFFTIARITARGLALALIAFALNGCVFRSDYDNAMALMQRQINDERASHAADVRSLELKLKDRAKTLEELTAKYSSLEQEKLSENNLHYGRDELDAVLKKIKELQVEVRENVRGPKAVEMTEALNEMERRINSLLGNPVYSN